MTTPEDFAALGAISLAIFALLGVFYRFILVPNLKRDLFTPVREMHRQITENGGRHDPPTIPDKMHSLQEAVEDNTLETKELRSDLALIAVRLGNHLRWSETELERVWAAIRTIEARLLGRDD